MGCGCGQRRKLALEARQQRLAKQAEERAAREAAKQAESEQAE